MTRSDRVEKELEHQDERALNIRGLDDHTKRLFASEAALAGKTYPEFVKVLLETYRQANDTT